MTTWIRPTAPLPPCESPELSLRTIRAPLTFPIGQLLVLGERVDDLLVGGAGEVKETTFPVAPVGSRSHRLLAMAHVGDVWHLVLAFFLLFLLGLVDDRPR